MCPVCRISFSTICNTDALNVLACYSLQRWTRDKALSFVPPDGHFTLLDYRYAPSGSASAIVGPSTPGLRGDLIPVPIVLKTSIEINEFGGMSATRLRYSERQRSNHGLAGTLDLTLTPRVSSRAIENLFAEWYLGEEATGASCMASGGQWNGGAGGSLPGDVSWAFDSKKKVRIVLDI